MEKDKLCINGYQFDSKESYEKAKKEQEAVIYIKEHTDFNNINQVIKVYNNAVGKKIFSTMIGYEFLKQMRNLIVKKGALEEGEISPIIITSHKEKSNAIVNQQDKYKILYEAEKTNKTIMKAAIVILILVIAIMVYVSRNGKNSIISDYENQIINKYEEWEEELQEREKAVEEREQKLE